MQPPASAGATFSEGRGYQRREWWADEGWAWKEPYDITKRHGRPGGRNRLAVCLTPGPVRLLGVVRRDRPLHRGADVAAWTQDGDPASRVWHLARHMSPERERR